MTPTRFRLPATPATILVEISTVFGNFAENNEECNHIGPDCHFLSFLRFFEQKIMGVALRKLIVSFAQASRCSAIFRR